MENSRAKVFSAIVSIAMGALLFIFAKHFLELVGVVIGIVFIITGVQKIISYIVFMRRNDIEATASMLIFGIISAVAGLFLIMSPMILEGVIKSVAAVWLIIMGLVSFIICYTYKKDEERNWWLVLADAIISVVIAILILVAPTVWEIFINLILPLKLILAGIAELAELMPNKDRKIRIKPPNWAEAFLPQKTLKRIKDRLKNDVVTSTNELSINFSSAEFEVDNIEVFVHMSERSSSSFGHVDIGIGNYVISYGNYDHSKKAVKLFGLLFDGVFFACPRKEYLKFSLSEAGKTILGYQLALNYEQKQKVRENIEKFAENCREWILDENDKNDSKFAWRIQECGSAIYHVYKSRFRTYFVLNTNCALLSELLLGEVGVPRSQALGGAVTPGSVYSMYGKAVGCENPSAGKENRICGR